MNTAAWCFLAFVVALAVFDGLRMSAHRKNVERFKRSLRGYDSKGGGV